ncbi:hypothetical protein EAL2_c14320 [Peptoclostridium acidaminophilum DSM 3953]|uniref:Uncharacterized protein n=1 Tax=Peptoclostridium acidaminophilum DSM 3953 TaxID=1286171 RepID=W8TKM1_PEPAC|nr:hypothetical protein EAL2_c14320 [Peptoclostridium acidaminophilum DSM 3953]
MDGILWIIFLIIINNILGKKKKASMQQKPKAQQLRKVKPAGKGIEDYFKDIAQKVQEQYQLEKQARTEGVSVEVIEPPKMAKSAPKKQPVRPAATAISDEYDESHPIYGSSQISSGITLFEQREDLVRGIIYSEILSKPISMRKKN